MALLRWKATPFWFIILFAFALVSGCLPEPEYDRWTVDIIYTGESSGVIQTFENVRPNEQFIDNESERRQYQQWFCDDQSDTFQREWKQYANRFGMQSLEYRSAETRPAGDGHCDVSIQGSLSGWIAPSTVFTKLLKSDSYTINRRGNDFWLAIQPDESLDKLKFELNLWLSGRFQGRLVSANTPVFESNPSDVRIGFDRVFQSSSRRAVTWRRARWTPETIRRNGIQFSFSGPIVHGQSNRSGPDNQPTWFPGRNQQE